MEYEDGEVLILGDAPPVIGELIKTPQKIAKKVGEFVNSLPDFDTDNITTSFDQTSIRFAS